ncbi:hypothetical protein GCM10009550_20720 [Actinocorallia libanotica]|uniref:TY-Chap N-terminal domain-containing protein n=2 Tax=Actinocorallia libanotica TaxID=46162 RepID=A0ABN1QRF5_9ACTN
MIAGSSPGSHGVVAADRVVPGGRAGEDLKGGTPPLLWNIRLRDFARFGMIVTLRRMENELPRGRWLEADAFERLVRQTVPLDMGGWRMGEVEHAVSALGWELGELEEDISLRWFAPRKGPWGGYGSVHADASDPGQALKLNVRVVDLPPEEVQERAGQLRAAWWIMEEVLGPPTMWGGGDAWMLWRRPGTSFLVETHDGGELSFELLCTDRDSDAAGRAGTRGLWRAAEPADLPSAVPARPAADWDEVREQLARALNRLNYDAPFFPGGFIVHLRSARDPLRFVQFWNHGLDLVVEATGYWHRPELADADRLTRQGWRSSHSMWQCRLPNAMDSSREHARTAARMLVDELRNLDVDLSDLVYSATMVGRGRRFHLDLPGLGLHRAVPDS